MKECGIFRIVRFDKFIYSSLLLTMSSQWFLRQRARLHCLYLVLSVTLIAVPAFSQVVSKELQSKLAKRESRRVNRIDVVHTRKHGTGVLLVKFRPTAKPAFRRALNDLHRARVLRNFKAVPGLELLKLDSSEDEEQTLRSYQMDPAVEYAEPNYELRASSDPNDSYFQQQWGLKNFAQLGGTAGIDINASNAWNVTTGSPNLVIAVIDSGVDYMHPDLTANIYTNPSECTPNGVDDDGNGYIDDCHGIDTFSHDSDPMDDLGHGTHVAGIIGAVGNNGRGISGVDWNIKILPCKFLNEQGYGEVSGAIECLSYIKDLKDSGVNIVASNNSWGGLEYSQALTDAIHAQEQSGILFIAAAGNEFHDNDQVPSYPASTFLPNIISVAATTNSDDWAFFSNLGLHSVHLGAPGQEILSTLPGAAYGIESGTSMSAPFVSGVAGLLAAQDNTRDWKQIKNLILTSGKQIPALQKTISGRRLDAYNALTCSGAPLFKRLRPIGDTISGAVGSPIFIAVTNIDCAVPAGSLLQVTASDGQTITLKDDGTGVDQEPEDGTYSGSWTPPALGNYLLQLPTSDTVAVTVLENYASVRYLPDYRVIAGTSLDLDDDSVAKIVSPFPIPFGKGSFSELWVSSNGTVSFTDPFVDFMNRPLPLRSDQVFMPGWDSEAVTLLSVFWDDLMPFKGTQNNVFWDVRGTAPDRELVVEWRDVGIFDCKTDPTQTMRFEVVFHEDKPDVEYQYADVSACGHHTGGGDATVGVQVAPDKATTYFFGGGVDALITDNSMVHWQPVSDPLPTNPVPTLYQLTPDSLPAGSPSTFIKATGTGFVPGSRASWNVSAGLATNYVSDTELQIEVPSYLTSFISDPARITVTNPAPGGGTSNFLVFGVGFEPLWINSLNPSSVQAGSAGFTLSVTGQHLSGVTMAFFADQSRNFRIISDSEVQLDVLASDVATAGTRNVNLYAQGLAGSSNVLSFAVTTSGTSTTGANAQAHFRKPEQAPTYKSLLAKRFLGWSFATIAGAEYTKAFSRDYSGQGLSASAVPGLALRNPIPTGFLPTGVASSDFNRDGMMDWAISNGGDDTIWIYPGRGDGTWNLPTIVPTLGASPVFLAAGDLDKDGDADLIVAEGDSRSIGVLRNNGNGRSCTFFRHGPLFCWSATSTAMEIRTFWLSWLALKRLAHWLFCRVMALVVWVIQ